MYADPITGKPDWNLILAPTGGIIGVASRSDDTPIKIGNFAEADKALEGEGKYSEWIFFYSPVPNGGLIRAGK